MRVTARTGVPSPTEVGDKIIRCSVVKVRCTPRERGATALAVGANRWRWCRLVPGEAFDTVSGALGGEGTTYCPRTASSPRDHQVVLVLAPPQEDEPPVHEVGTGDLT